MTQSKTQHAARKAVRPSAPPGSARRPGAARDRRVQSEIEVALATERFSLTSEPRFDLHSARCVGAEVGLVVRRRRRGAVPPALYGPVAERSGQAPRLGFWLLRAACSLGLARRCVVSVPIGQAQLTSGALRDQVADALEESRLPPEQLELAVAEPLLTGIGVNTLLTLSAIRDLGVGLALDDFGTGLASLALLRRLPLTAMKLGPDLVRDLPWDREHATIMRAILHSGHALGLQMIADGIATESQRTFLVGAGCDLGQGPLFGLPSPVARDIWFA